MSNEANYTVTEDDTVAALRLHWKPSSRIRSFQLFIAVFVVILAFVGPTNMIKILSLICIAVYILTRRILGPYIQRRTYRGYKLLQEPVSLYYDVNGVKFSSESYNKSLDWNQVVRWKDDERLILIYVSPRQYYVIPKWIRNECFNVEEFLETLRKYI